MLTIRKIGSGQAGDYSAYLAGRADNEREAWQERQGDYYTGSSEDAPDAAGLWHGDVSTLGALGVEAGALVERDELARALRGLRADTGESLRRPGANGVVNSHDLTMGAPKSVSVLWAQSSPERRAAIEQAAREAAVATVRYMAFTTDCIQRRTESGERVWEPARGVASAHFVHHTARRASAASVPDPHLHVHCVVVAVERSDGRIVTPNQAAWVRHGREGGAYFRSELASRLLELGLEIESGTGKQGRYFEIAGVPREVRERLSGRSYEVEAAYAEFVARYGRPPVEGELADLATKSRERKGPETVAEIEPYWRAVAAEHGFDAVAAERLWGREVEPVVSERVREWFAAELAARIEAQGATVRMREARAMAYELSAGRLTPDDAMRLVTDMQERGLLIALTEDRVTTRSTRALERYCIDTTRTLAATEAAPLGRDVVDRAVGAVGQSFGGALTSEQATAADVLASDARVAGLVGRAGTGKGVVLEAASAAYRAEGWQVIAVATQGARARGLGTQTSGKVMTINQLAHRADTGRVVLDQRTVIFVDEAAMVDTHRMADLLRLTTDSGASLRLVGDPAQLSAIGPGGLLPTMFAVEGVRVAELAQIHRTPHQWLRDFQNLVRDGRSLDALAILHEHNAAHMLDTHTDAMRHMVSHWDIWRRDYDTGDTLMVVHTSNTDVDAVNVLAQERRHAAGELGREGIPSPDRDYLLHEGDRVMLRERAYYTGTPGEPRIENGTRGTILTVDPSTSTVMVAFDQPGRDARIARVDLDRSAALRLDYASHVYPAQGDTRSRTAELTGGASISRESAYVGGSRLRERHDLYTSREALGTDGTDHERWQRLADQMNQSRAQLPSIAYREAQSRRIAVEQPAPALDPERARLATLDRDLTAANAELLRLRQSFPHEAQREIERHARRHREATTELRSVERMLTEERRRLEGLRPWQRDQIKETRRSIDLLTQRHARELAAANEHARTHNDLIRSSESPSAWRREHGAALAKHEQRVHDLTRQRDAQREHVITRAIEQSPRYLTRALGERPAESKQRAAWDNAVREIETYRARFDVRDPRTALGLQPGYGTQHDHFNRTAEQIGRVQRATGHTREAHTLAHYRPGAERGFGRGIGGFSR